MVVSSPQEFPLTRENVILIRQVSLTRSFYADLFNFSLIFLSKNNLSIARPGNENLVALQPTVSGNFETLTVWKFSGKAWRH